MLNIKIFSVEDSEKEIEGFTVLNVLDLSAETLEYFRKSIENNNSLDTIAPAVYESLDESAMHISEKIAEETHLKEVNIFLYYGDADIFTESLEKYLNFKSIEAKISEQEDGSYMMHLCISFVTDKETYLDFTSFEPMDHLDPKVLEDKCGNPKLPGLN